MHIKVFDVHMYCIRTKQYNTSKNKKKEEDHFKTVGVFFLKIAGTGEVMCQC